VWYELDGDAAGAGRQVVPRQRALPAFIQLALAVQRQRMRGDHKAGAELLAQRHLESPILVWSGLACPAWRCLVESILAIQAIISSGETFGAPKRPFAFVTSLSRALAPPTPETNSGSTPKWRPKSSAISLTASAAVPVMFKTRGGD